MSCFLAKMQNNSVRMISHTIDGCNHLHQQSKLRAVELWRTAFGPVKPQLIGAGRLLDSWRQEVEGLMQDWAADADGAGRRWEGAGWRDAGAAKLEERIGEVGGVLLLPYPV
jgi:hypothetical protein